MATILVVDDELPIVDLLTEIIEEAGHTSLRATNGRDALLLAQQHRPSLIVSDIKMPIMDGYTLLHELRTDQIFTHTMVILMSAHASPVEMYNSEATAFTQKPLDLLMIESFIRRLPQNKQE